MNRGTRSPERHAPRQPRSRCRLARSLGAVVLLVCAAATTHGQEQRSSLGEGTHIFRRLLHDRDFTPLKSFEELSDRPDRSIVVVLGNLDRIAEFPEGIGGFVWRGGALLIASDRPIQSPQTRRELWRLTGTTITGLSLRCNLEWERMRYRDKDFCPILQPVAGATPALFGVGDFGGVGGLRVATNLPSSLAIARSLPGDLEVLARLPPGTGAAGGSLLRDLVAPGPRDFAVGGDFGDGRVLVLADHSIFINEMMLPADNDNLEFAENCLTWLSGERGERTQVLFVEDGRIITQFDVPLKTIELPEGAEQALLAMMNREILRGGDQLMKLEDGDAFGRSIQRWLSERRVNLGRTLFFLATVVALIYLAHRVGGRGRYHPELGLPRLAPAVASQLPVDPVLAQRRDALLDGGNLREVARHLARRWLADVGLPTPDGSAKTPTVQECEGGWWARRALNRRLRRLWLLAGDAPMRVRPADCERLRAEIDSLSTAVDRGEMRLQTRV